MLLPILRWRYHIDFLFRIFSQPGNYMERQRESNICFFSKQQQTFVFEPLAEQKILRIQQQG